MILHDLLVLAAWAVISLSLGMLVCGCVCFAYYMVKEVFRDGKK